MLRSWYACAKFPSLIARSYGSRSGAGAVESVEGFIGLRTNGLIWKDRFNPFLFDWIGGKHCHETKYTLHDILVAWRAGGSSSS